MARNSRRASRRPEPDEPPRRAAWRERAVVLGGLTLAVPATPVSFALGADGGIVGFMWLVAVAWTALASLACALRSGFLHGDWSAFSGGRRRHGCVPDIRGESFDWNTRTGAFAYMRIADGRERLLGDDGLRNPDQDP